MSDVNQYFDGYSISADTKQYLDHVDGAIDLAVLRGDKALREQDDFFFGIKSPSTTFKMTDVGSILDLPKRNNDEDDLPASTPAPGRATTFTPLQYRQKVQITKRFMKTDRLGMGMVLAGGLPSAVTRKKQYLMAVIFANAFTSGTGADGDYLCSASHDPVNPNGTARSNLGTGPLSVDNWHALRLRMVKQVDELGYPKPGDITDLGIPPDLERKATEMLKSKLDPEGSMNTETVLTNFKIRLMHYWTASTTAYFGFNMSIPAQQRGMYHVYLTEGPDLQDCKPSDNPGIVWAKMAEYDGTYGFTEATEYIVGSDGT